MKELEGIDIFVGNLVYHKCFNIPIVIFEVKDFPDGRNITGRYYNEITGKFGLDYFKPSELWKGKAEK